MLYHTALCYKSLILSWKTKYTISVYTQKSFQNIIGTAPKYAVIIGIYGELHFKLKFGRIWGFLIIFLEYWGYKSILPSEANVG